MAKAGLQFTDKDEWYTPKSLVEKFGKFDYDPATTKERAEYLGIPNYDTIETDGLTKDWTQYKRIWINPPFTRKFEFLRKAADTARSSLTEICFLLPIDSMVTKRFHEAVGDTAYELYLPSSRVKFEDGTSRTTSPAFGSVVLRLHIGDTKAIKHFDID